MALSKKEIIEAIKGMSKDEKKDIRKALGVSETTSAIDDVKDEEKKLQYKREALELEIAQAQALGESVTAAQAAYKLERELLGLKQEAYMNIEAYEEAEKALKAAKEANNEEDIKFYENEIKKADAIDEANAKIDEQIARMKHLQKASKELDKVEQKRLEYAKDAFEDIAVKLGINSRAANNMVKKYTKIFADGQARNAAKEVFNLNKVSLAVFAQIISSSIKLATAVDRASAAFAAQTGAGRVLEEQIGNVGRNFVALGISAEDAGKAGGALFENFVGFMQTIPAGREDLMQTVAALEKIGVDSATSSKTLNLLTKNFGMSTKEATKLTKQLSIMGTQMGISSKKMISGFQEASKVLAVYGKQAVKIYSDVAAMAKMAGMETNELLQITGKFDTFSGAA